jgi:hypothetical protein
MQHFFSLLVISMMKLRYLPIISLLFLLPLAVKADAIEQIAALLKKGNAQELATLFAANIDLSVLDQNDLYSKAQAAMILDKFFRENKPQSVKLLHRINSNPKYNYGVVILSTDKGKFRISYTLKEVNKVMVVIELRIETEKT